MGSDDTERVTYEMRAAKPTASSAACVLLHGIVLGLGFVIALVN